MCETEIVLFAFRVEKETKKLREHLVTDSLVCQLQVGAVMVACNRVTVRLLESALCYSS